MNNHALAEHMKLVARFLESCDDFDICGVAATTFSEKLGFQTKLNFYDKEKFTKAAKLFGSATKTLEEGAFARLKLVSNIAPITLEIPRDVLCRNIVKFEREPLFSTKELNDLQSEEQ